MSEKEVMCIPVMEDFMAKKINANEAALLLGLSDRHIYRLKEVLDRRDL